MNANNLHDEQLPQGHGNEADWAPVDFSETDLLFAEQPTPEVALESGESAHVDIDTAGTLVADETSLVDDHFVEATASLVTQVEESVSMREQPQHVVSPMGVTPTVHPTRRPIARALGLDRVEDYRSPYAAMYVEMLELEDRVLQARNDMLELEQRIDAGVGGLLDRQEQLIERAERAAAAMDLAKDMLGQQAKLIAGAFRDQLTKTELDGVVTLLGHVLEISDRSAMLATNAMNQVADEAAAGAGLKAEVAALQRITSTVAEEAKKAGLHDAVLAVASMATRLGGAVERLEQLQAAPQVAPTQQAPQPSVHQQPQGLGALPLAWMWARHHLGAPGVVIGLAAASLAIYKGFG
jgi:hypothetical protein